VVSGSPAYRAGLKAGDVIISLGDGPVLSVDDIHRRLTASSIGRSLKMVLLRDWIVRLEKEIMPSENQG
jgi:serine protease Do